MKKPIYLFLVVTLLLSLSFISAAIYNQPFNHRYQGDPFKSSASYYNQNYNDGAGTYDNYGNYRYNLQRHAPVPIFKGGNGNYRVQGYFNGDQRPSFFWNDYPESYNRPYFSGGINSYGSGGYGGLNSFNSFGLGNYNRGYNNYNSFGIGISRYSPTYSYNNYGNSYFPSYDYQYIGGCSYSC